MSGDEALLDVRGLVKHFPLTRGVIFRRETRRRARGRRCELHGGPW